MGDESHLRDEHILNVERRMEKSEDRQDSFDTRLNGALITISEAVYEISAFVKQLVALETRHEVRFEETKSTWERTFKRIDLGEERIRQLEIWIAKTAPENKATGDWVKLVIAMVIGGAVTSALAHLFK